MPKCMNKNKLIITRSVTGHNLTVAIDLFRPVHVIRSNYNNNFWYRDIATEYIIVQNGR